MSSQVPQFRLCIDYVLDTVPNIIDLSGHTPFVLTIAIVRPRGQHPEAHSSFIDVVINALVLDVSSALQTGQLSLVEAEGDYPKKKWRDCVRRDLPKEVFYEQSRPHLNIPKVVRINPGQLAQPTGPQRLVCSLTPVISSVFNDQHLYRFTYPPAAPDGQDWDGGISWWKLCSDSSRPPDISALTDQPHAKVKRTSLPIFEAMANPPRPPRIEYKLEIVPSQGDPTLLGEQRWWNQKLTQWNFDVFDLTPTQIYTADCELRDENDLSNSFAKAFSIDDVGALSGRRLEVRLRPVQMFWTTKGIDELFRDPDTVRREYWYIPLMIESPAVAEVSDVQ